MESTLLQLLENERQTIFNQYANRPEHERKRLWEQRKAQLSSIIKSDNVSSRPQDARVPRTMSYNGSSSIRNSNLGINTHSSMNRTEGLSVQSAPAAVSMSRSPSSYSATDDAFSFNDGYTISPNMYSPNQANIQTINEYTPTEYINTCITPSISIKQDSSRQSISFPYTWNHQFDGSASPSTSTSGELTTASTLASDMSREASYCTQFGDISLSRNFSQFSSDSFSEEHLYPSPDVKTISLSDTEPSSFLSLSDYTDRTTNPISGAVFSSSQFPSSASAQSSSLQYEQSNPAEDMKRATSIESNKSSNSSNSRHSRRRQEQIAHGSRPIAPKAIQKHASSSSTRHSSSQTKMMRVHSQDGSSKDVAQIAKAPYIRPHHPKVMCPHCTEFPGGFRGEHELRRHTERAHAAVKKVWVTVDASPDKKFLANCKQCRAGKQYGAYYNVAAHLRRAHFHPRKRGRKGKHDEKRGGKGGGDDPPMEVLKAHWIKEIQVVSSASNDDSVLDQSDDEQLDMSTTPNYADSNANTQYDHNVSYPMSHSVSQPEYMNAFVDDDPTTFTSTFTNSYQPSHFDALQPDMAIDTNNALFNTAFEFDAQPQYDMQYLPQTVSMM